MRRYEYKRTLHLFGVSWNIRHIVALSVILIISCADQLHAQTAGTDPIEQQVERLEAAMSKAQAQIEQSQHDLKEMRQQLDELQARINKGQPADSPSSTAPVATQSDIQEVRDRQAVDESQIATHEQTKVESESKYPVKITGLILLNGFVNTRGVDMAATPTVATADSGSTGATLRQTVLGLDARGPHLFGASSAAGLRIDFNGNPQANTLATAYTGFYGTSSTLLRIRTAHADLKWARTDAFFSLDKPILNPDSPTSLAAVAEPSLSWSGNLWTWNPQAGVTQDVALGNSHAFQFQAALIDVQDAPVSPLLPSGTAVVTPTSERSRWPGIEAHMSLHDSKEDGNQFGVGGYFSSHLTPVDVRFDSWAATLNTRLHLPLRLEFTGSAYRGSALGGLGAGAFKDYVYHENSVTGQYHIFPLDDVGGWTQLKEKVNERLEFNAAFGLDNVFSKQLRRYVVINGTPFQNLARNRTFTGNVIYSPSAYLLFSLEYRRLESAPIIGVTNATDVIGIAAGYKF